MFHAVFYSFDGLKAVFRHVNAGAIGKVLIIFGIVDNKNLIAVLAESA